jgi:hypothetical protein
MHDACSCCEAVDDILLDELAAEVLAEQGRPQRLNVFCDVDQTIMGIDGSLRNGVVELFERLRADGHAVYIWSGVGRRDLDVARLGLTELVDGVFVKPIANFEAGLVELEVTVRPDFVIDDHEAIVEHFGGVRVAEFLWRTDPPDTQMEQVYAAISRRVEEAR